MTRSPDVDGTQPQLPVRAEVWGATPGDAEKAIDSARRPPSRSGWSFTRIDRLTNSRCPIDARNPAPHTLAADSGDGWAYAVYAVRADGC